MADFLKQLKRIVMKNKLLILLVLAISFSACQDNEEYWDEFDDLSQNDEEYNEPEEEGNNSDHNHDGAEGQLTLYQILGADLSKIKDFNVGSDLLAFQQDYQKHFDMWNFVTRLIPENQRSRLVEFEVFHGGGDLLGYVEPINEGDLSQWKFALAIDAAEKIEEIDFQNLFTYVTIHEFGHVLTLNENQINADANSCNGFETQEGCARSDSYLNQLFKIGWADIYNEFENLEEDEGEDFYEKYKDRFVSDYAATNPGEDIAEVFAFFITEPNRPNGNTIADQKMKMMYEQDELVELREQIRQSESVLRLQPGSWLTNPLRKQFRIGRQHKH